MANFTEEAIKSTFLELLQHKSVSKITVREIVDACGINRNTFYYHYDSIPDLVEEIVSDITDSLVRENASVKTLEECIEIGANVALEYKRVLLNIYNSSNRSVYEIHLMRLCQNVVELYIDSVFGDTVVSDEDREILIRFYKCECFGQVIEWMNNNMSYNIVEQFSRLCKIREGFAEEVVRRCRLN